MDNGGKTFYDRILSVQIWKRAVPITIAVIFLLPLLATWHLLTSNGTFATKDNETFTMSVSGGVPWVSDITYIST